MQIIKGVVFSESWTSAADKMSSQYHFFTPNQYIEGLDEITDIIEGEIAIENLLKETGKFWN